MLPRWVLHAHERLGASTDRHRKPWIEANPTLGIGSLGVHPCTLVYCVCPRSGCNAVHAEVDDGLAYSTHRTGKGAVLQARTGVDEL
jgi:hypothetical protein